MKTHEYQTQLSWVGSTAQGYERYERAHRGWAPPAEPKLALSADPAYRGDSRLLNPEQLVVMAASSCQLLSFLAVAARARLDVISYEDDAHAVMPTGEKPIFITKIVLRPRITLRTGPTVEQVRHLCEVAHRECFIASSLKSEIVIESEVRFV